MISTKSALKKLQKKWIGFHVNYYVEHCIPYSIDDNYSGWLRSYLLKYIDVTPTLIKDHVIESSIVKKNTKVMFNESITKETIAENNLFDALKGVKDELLFKCFGFATLDDKNTNLYKKGKYDSLMDSTETIISDITKNNIERLKSNVFCIDLEGIDPFIAILRDDSVDTYPLELCIEKLEPNLTLVDK